MVPAGEIGGDLRCEGAMAHRRAQHPAADPSLHRAHCGRVEVAGGVEAQRAVSIEAEQAVGDAAVQMRVGIERGAEALHERHCAAA